MLDSLHFSLQAIFDLSASLDELESSLAVVDELVIDLKRITESKESIEKRLHNESIENAESSLGKLTVRW